MSFEAGKQAALNGLTLADNPHTDGFTKLGAVRLTEEGIAWEAGFRSTIAARMASQKEMQAANSVEVSRFRWKANRYYR